MDLSVTSEERPPKKVKNVERNEGQEKVKEMLSEKKEKEKPRDEKPDAGVVTGTGAEPATVRKETNANSQQNALDLSSHHEPTAGSSIHLKAEVNLSAIKFRRILLQNPQNKTIFVEGEFNGQTAVLVLEKTPITEETVKKMLADSETTGKPLERDFFNDIYGNYTLYPSSALNGIKTTIIHPATEQHIKKYTAQEFLLVEESYDNYLKITLPFIETSNLKLDWVYNILEHKSEAERIVTEDEDPETGFVLIPDLKWDQKQVENLYLIAICRKKGIKSLRDLTSDHLALLLNIKAKATKAIVSKYDISPGKLRIYVHYQPSYYHFHVHFTRLGFDAPGCRVERAHLIETVISNLTLCPDYYQRSSLTFPVKESEPLYQAFSESNQL